MQVVLVMFRADGERRSFSVTHEVTLLGRREDCHLRIPLGDVSRKHCRLVKEDGTLRIEDMGSSNGTYVNGERVQETALNPGDTVQVGPVVFVVQIDGVPADDEIQPALPEAATTVPADESGGQTVRSDEPVPLTGDDSIQFTLEDAPEDADIPLELLDDREPKPKPNQQRK